MGVIDAIKKGFEIANKNLLLVLVNAALYIGAFIVAAFVFVIFAVAAAGSLSSLPENPQDLETFFNSLAMSAGVIVMMVAAFIGIMIFFWVLYSFVQAGSLGSVIGTARGTVKGFEWGVFWENLKRSGLSILWLNILWGLIALGIFVALGIVGLVGVLGVLVPLKDAGNTMAAYGFGVPFVAVLVLIYMFSIFMVYAGTMMSGVALVDRRIDSISAMSEALDFIKEHFWDVLALALLLGLISFAVGMAFGIVRALFNFIPVVGPIIAIFIILPIEMCINLYITIVIMSAFAVMFLGRTGGLQSPVASESIAPPGSESAAMGTSGSDTPYPGTGPDIGEPFGSNPEETSVVPEQPFTAPVEPVPAHTEHEDFTILVEEPTVTEESEVVPPSYYAEPGPQTPPKRRPAPADDDEEGERDS